MRFGIQEDSWSQSGDGLMRLTEIRIARTLLSGLLAPDLIACSREADAITLRALVSEPHPTLQLKMLVEAPSAAIEHDTRTGVMVVSEQNATMRKLGVKTQAQLVERVRGLGRS